MNEATAARLAIARRIAPGYLRNPKVAALIVAGSVGRGIADEYSDLELDFFWHEPPTEAERRAPVEAAGGEVRTLNPFEDDEWAEELALDGLKADTSMFLVGTMDRYLEAVIDRASIEEGPQFLISAVQYSLPLSGEAMVERWRAKAATYPEALRRAMVTQHLRQPARWYCAAMLAARDDLVFLHEVTVSVVRAMVRVLLGLNRVYLPHPNLKWIDHLAGELALAPERLSARHKAVHAADPPERVRSLQALPEETLALVEREWPDLDTSDARAWMADALGSRTPPL